MAEESLRSSIEGIRTHLQQELDTHLAALADTHTRTVEQARHSAAAEAERHWSAQVEAGRTEWSARLATELARVRAENEQAVLAERARVHLEIETAAEKAADAARREVQQSVAADRQRLDAQLDAARRRTSELELERERVAAELTAQRQRVSELESERERTAGELDALRARVAQIEAERQSISELQAERDRLAARHAEGERHATELQTLRQRMAEFELDHARVTADLATERAQAETRIASERQRATALPAAPSNPPLDSSTLLESLRAVDEASSLTGILGAAVRGAAAEADRATLFVIDGAQLRELAVADVPLMDSGPLRVDVGEAGIIAEALRRGALASTSMPGAPAAPFFANLPSEGTAMAVPIIVGGTPVAVLYADHRAARLSGSDAQLRIEILGRHTAACAASLTAARIAQAMRLISGDLPESGSADPAGQGDEHAARRYARLLVSEIKMYNESAVRAGREQRDLLRRLEPEIERARRLYDEKVPPSVAGRGTLFDQELAQTLADGNVTLLGAPGHPQQSW